MEEWPILFRNMSITSSVPLVVSNLVGLVLIIKID